MNKNGMHGIQSISSAPRIVARLLLILPLALLPGCPIGLFAAEPGATGPAKSVADAEIAYTQTIEKRVGDILSGIELSDSGKSNRLHTLLIAQYRALRDWHDTDDTKLKNATEEQARQMKASLEAIHKKFVSSLAAELSPGQLEQVKDKMTYGTVKVTYDAYCEIVPNLTTVEKQRILELLKEGREEALDGGSHTEKAAIFKKYKGKINNYLDSQGHDVKQAYKDWGAKQKAKSGSKPATPAPQPEKQN